MHILLARRKASKCSDLTNGSFSVVPRYLIVLHVRLHACMHHCVPILKDLIQLKRSAAPTQVGSTFFQQTSISIREIRAGGEESSCKLGSSILSPRTGHGIDPQ
jgi:hypothetical protein